MIIINNNNNNNNNNNKTIKQTSVESYTGFSCTWLYRSF